MKKGEWDDRPVRQGGADYGGWRRRGWGGGAVVIVSSVAALGGSSRNSSYSAAKGGLVALGRTIALGYAAKRIRCNIVCPGALSRTPNHELLADPDGWGERLAPKIPLGRV